MRFLKTQINFEKACKARFFKIYLDYTLIYGQQYLNKAGIAIAIDAVSVLLFISYLIGYFIGDRRKGIPKGI